MKGQTISKLFEGINLNNIKLNIRIAMAPMTRSRAIGYVPNDLMVKYYQQRASAGLIITEGIAPSPNGLGYARIAGIYSQEQIDGWKKITDVVHAEGGKIFAQLMHVGRVAHPVNMPAGAKVLAPSAVAATGEIWTDAEGMQPYATPAEMNGEELQAAIQEFVNTSKNSIEAGFDGIELHGANGYLLEQFLNPHTNTRTDAYGGSVENRIRFVVEVTKRVAEAIGKERVGIRLSPYNQFNGMSLYDEVFETYDKLTKEIGKLDIAYIHLVDYAARQYNADLIDIIRSNFSGTYILNAGYTLERANEVLEAGVADMVSFGSPFISNPDLPHRLQNNIALTQPDPSLFFTPGEQGYIDYAFAAETENANA
ncbi:MAG: alkene reductase [Sphingobacteriales bacterium]|nr:MAG: alkene reductase [Sphingobacteriales bacterium]